MRLRARSASARRRPSFAPPSQRRRVHAKGAQARRRIRLPAHLLARPSDPRVPRRVGGSASNDQRRRSGKVESAGRLAAYPECRDGTWRRHDAPRFWWLGGRVISWVFGVRRGRTAVDQPLCISYRGHTLRSLVMDVSGAARRAECFTVLGRWPCSL